MSNNWTAEQKLAIEHRGNNLLVSAGAGSGKTAVLVERIINHLTNPLSPLGLDELLVVTFTNEAATEMRQRIGQRLTALAHEGENPFLGRQLGLLQQASITTLHSFCLDIIRQNFYYLDLDPNFRILKETEKNLLEESVLNEYLEKEYSQNNFLLQELADCYGGAKDDRELLVFIRKLYEFTRSQPYPQLWLQDAVSNLHIVGQEITAEKWGQYLTEHISKQLKIAAEYWTRCLEISSEEPDLLDKMEFYRAEQQSIFALSDSLDDSWESFYTAIKDFSFATFRFPKAVDGETKEILKNYREKGKEIVKELKETYAAYPLGDYLQDVDKIAVLMKGLAELVLGFSQQIAEKKLSLNLIDFADMEHYCLQILEDESNGVRAELQNKFKEVLVDEFQDINNVQERILQLVSATDNRFIVGDIKQSIYGFRLAEPDLFLTKFNNYQQKIDGIRIDLQRNFRSMPNIIHGVNFIFRQLMSNDFAGMDYGESSQLIAGRTDEDSQPIEVHLFDNQEYSGNFVAGENEEESLSKMQREARFIGKRILELQKEGYHYKDMAILLRSPKNNDLVVVEELRLLGIPALNSSKISYLSSPEVAIILAVLQVIDNPRQDIPLTAVLRCPLGKFTLDELTNLRLNHSGCLYEALKAGCDLPDGLGEKVSQFLALLKQWRAIANYGRISKIVGHIYLDNGFYAFVGALPEGVQRQGNLTAFYNKIREYEETSFKGLFRFLRFIQDILDHGDNLEATNILGDSDDAVRIMSIHKSKGLEFPVIFLANLGKNFNISDMNKDILWHKEFGLGAVVADREKRVKYPTLISKAIGEKIKTETISEELRILYVAMTRARDRLILVGTVRNLNKSILSWSETAGLEQTTFPYYSLTADKSYLDWLCRCLLRHPDAYELRALTPKSASQRNHTLWQDSSHWQITVENTAVRQAESDNEPVLQLSDYISHLLPLPATKYQQQVEQILAWQYPYAVDTQLRGKYTVTELQKRFYDSVAQDGESVLMATGDKMAAKEITAAKKIIHHQQQGLTAAEIGIAYHSVLEHIDLAALKAGVSLEVLLDQLVAKGLLPVHWRNAVDEQNLAAFFEAEIGQKLLHSSHVERELAFTYKQSAKKMLNIDSDEIVVLQGMIDLAFYDDDNWIIVDYKTGNQNKTDSEIIAAYQKQLQYYADAFSKIVKQPVAECWLYLINGKRFLRV